MPHQLAWFGPARARDRPQGNPAGAMSREEFLAAVSGLGALRVAQELFHAAQAVLQSNQSCWKAVKAGRGARERWPPHAATSHNG